MRLPNASQHRPRPLDVLGCSPPTKMVSVPCSAPSEPPDTGASTRPMPCAASRSAMLGRCRRRHRRAVDHQPARRASRRRRRRSPNSTPRRSGVSETQVSTARLRRAASAGGGARAAPSSASGSSRSRVRLCTVTSWPAASRCRAIGPPSCPVDHPDPRSTATAPTSASAGSLSSPGSRCSGGLGALSGSCSATSSAGSEPAPRLTPASGLAPPIAISRRDQVIEHQQLHDRQRVAAVQAGADRELAQPLRAQVAGEVHVLPDPLLELERRRRGRAGPARADPARRSRPPATGRARSSPSTSDRSGCGRPGRSSRWASRWVASASSSAPGGGEKRTTMSASWRWGRMNCSESGSRRSSSSSTWLVV